MPLPKTNLSWRLRRAGEKRRTSTWTALEEIALASRQPNLEEIFLDTVQKDPADRQAFLEETCADSNVRTRVEALVKSHDSAGDFLEHPAVQPASMAGAQGSLEHCCDTTFARDTINVLDLCDTPGRLGLLAHSNILED